MPRVTSRKLSASIGLMAIAVAGALAGCTSAAEVSEEGADDGAARDLSHKIALDYPMTSLGVYAVLVENMEAAAEEAGYEVVLTDDQSSVDRQITNLTALVESDVDAIISLPMEPDAVLGLQQQAQGNGILWLNYGSHLEGEDGSIDLSGVETGREQARAFAEWAEGEGIVEGTVLLGVWDEDHLGRTRTQGLREGMEEFAPAFTIVEQAAVDTEQGLAAARAELAKNSGLVGALTISDDSAIGVAQGFKEAGLTSSDPVYVGGNDGAPQVLEMIAAGDSVIRSTVALDFPALGRGLAETPIALLEGDGDGVYVAEFDVVTKDSSALADLLGA